MTRRHLRSLLLVAVALTAGCLPESGSPAGGGPHPGQLPPGARVTVPLEADVDTSFVERILEDGQVTAAELDQSYLALIACLEENGGEGTYAFDVETGSGLSTDWGIRSDTDGQLTEQVYARCEAMFVGAVPSAYSQANPPSAEQERRRMDRIVACVLDVAPELSASIPQDPSIEGLYALEEGQPTGVAVAVNRCINADGVEWRTFGS